ncbi:GtrA family protein [Orrella marina]|uniref:GtrA family protein n=1 Tax=Orrella marina TaxID=2163011 RepID=A0A2R4XI95_9BURK|nr:GtrA family protein [Orrella marina]AWB33537.1 GtrA family protein [Orrella marina]
MKRLMRQLFWFVVVGTSSALVHWLVVVALVTHFTMNPLLANVAGWLIAFVVSFTGHYQLTFRHQNTAALSAVRRFFALSASGFLINETSYALLLTYTSINYEWLLAGVLIGVAFLTFVASKLWAFAPQRVTG